MTTHSQFYHKARHFLALFIVLGCCFHVTAARERQQDQRSKHQIFSSKKAQLPQNATERQDSLVISAIGKFLPEGWRPRLANVPTDYLTVVLNAIGVMGIGFLWIKEISAAFGTPIFAPILIPPLVLLCAGILLIPDLSRLGELLEQAVAN